MFSLGGCDTIPISMKNKIKSINSKLKKIPEILAVYLFGSSIYGKKGKLSDLDVGVVFKEPNKFLDDPKKSLKIYEQLFDVFAPLVENTNQLDLVFLQKAPLALQKEAVVKGKLIYDQKKGASEYEEKALLKYADIKPIMSEFYQEIYQTRL